MAKQIAVNARFYSHRMTGMQRYAAVLSKLFGADAECIRPGRPLKGMTGHLWEQAYLPFATGKRLLWSPNNTGPIGVSNQVCTIHDLIPLDRPEWFNPRFSAWYGWVLPKLAARVAHIIAISEFTKERIVNLLNVKPEKVTVIPNGVDKFERASAYDIELTRASLGISSSRYLLCLGSLEPRKNVSRLIRAWARVRKDLPEDLLLVIAGGNANSLVFSGTQAPVAQDGVHFTGYVSDECLPSLYSGAMAMIYPSLYEGFGLPPLEAMTCGTPVITSNSTSLPEVVGSAAILIDPEDEHSIGEGIRKLVEDLDLRQELSRKAVSQAALYDWNVTASATWKLLQAHAS